MKAPDKIYIQTNRGETLSSKWTTLPFRDFENTEYLRKEALLEWARAEKEKCSIGLSEYDMWMENGKLEILNGLIDKLNSI